MPFCTPYVLDCLCHIDCNSGAPDFNDTAFFICQRSATLGVLHVVVILLLLPSLFAVLVSSSAPANMFDKHNVCHWTTSTDLL